MLSGFRYRKLDNLDYDERSVIALPDFGLRVRAKQRNAVCISLI